MDRIQILARWLAEEFREIPRHWDEEAKTNSPAYQHNNPIMTDWERGDWLRLATEAFQKVDSQLSKSTLETDMDRPLTCEAEIERIIRVCMQREHCDPNFTVQDRYKVAAAARQAIMDRINGFGKPMFDAMII